MESNLLAPRLLDCYFVPDKKTTSATICVNCGKEKFLHTIGEGIKATSIIIHHDKKINQNDNS